MYCVKCGAELPPDSQFCTACGAKVENSTVEAEPNVAPIAPPPVDQSLADSQPPKKKSKALLWTLIGVGVALIVAAVLIFVVFAPGGSTGPFSGNTVQTRFANDVVGVFTGAFDGLDANNNMKKIADEPFELTMTSSTEVSGIKTGMGMDYAYDEKAFGLTSTTTTDYSGSEFADYFGDETTMESTMKMLLLDDTLYIDQDGSTTGIRFDTEADLSKSMSIKERIAALFENNKMSKIDFLQLAELFINSIDESNFDKSSDEATLTLNGDALAETLSTFADNLKDNDELNDSLTDMIEEMSGYPLDLSSAISLFAPMIKDSDFEMAISVSYDKGHPVGLEITFEESGSEVFNATFNYENIKDGKSFMLDVSSPDGQILSLNLNITKTNSGYDFDGAVSIPGTDDITISGSEDITGDNVSGTTEIVMGDQTVTMNYDETVKIGMPTEAVEDDSRFEIDTENANIIDLSDIFSGGFSPDLTSMPSLLG